MNDFIRYLLYVVYNLTIRMRILACYFKEGRILLKTGPAITTDYHSCF
jgi:hypothetical protein